MRVNPVQKQKPQTFGSASLFNLTSGLESNVLLNKAIFDITGSDIPWVIMANNEEERRERTNRGALSVMMVFISPLVALPFVNRFGMKYVSKLTPKLFDKQYNAVKLSNEYLTSAQKTKEGLEKLAQELKAQKKPVNLDVDDLLKRADNDYDKLRKKIINAKNIVLGFDMLMVSGVFGHIGFYNDWQTHRKTGRHGFSAEFNMADNAVIEQRAKKQEQIKKAKYIGFLSALAASGIVLPLVVRRGLGSSAKTNFIKRHGEIFDYKDAIFMSRWPMALSFVTAHVGVFLASRNASEMKDNAIRSSTAISIFFLGDLLLASLLGQLSDKVLGTKVINRHPKNKSILNGMLPPAKALKALENINDPKTKVIATAIFWFNFISLSILSGFIAPTIINRIIKKDVSADAQKVQTSRGK